MIIYMTLETDDGEYELEIEATGHINPPNLLADNPQDYYGEIYIEWNVLEAVLEAADDENYDIQLSKEEIAELEIKYQHDIYEHVSNEVLNSQGSFEE